MVLFLFLNQSKEKEKEKSPATEPVCLATLIGREFLQIMNHILCAPFFFLRVERERESSLSRREARNLFWLGIVGACDVVAV